MRDFDGWHSTIGIDRFKRLFFQVALKNNLAPALATLSNRETDEIHHDVLIGNAEFLHDDGDLPWVGALINVSDVEENRGIGTTYTSVGVELNWLGHCEDEDRMRTVDKFVCNERRVFARGQWFGCVADD